MIELRRRNSATTDASYVTDGLLFWFDGLQNASSEKWIDLIQGVEFINIGAKYDNNGYIIGEGYLECSEPILCNLKWDEEKTLEIVFTDYGNYNETYNFLFSNNNSLGGICGTFFNYSGLKRFVVTCQDGQSMIGTSIEAESYNGFRTISINNDNALDNLNPKTIQYDSIATASDINKSTIGCRRRQGANSFPFRGKIHSIRIYSRRLSASEMQNNQKIDFARFN